MPRCGAGWRPTRRPQASARRSSPSRSGGRGGRPPRRSPTTRRRRRGAERPGSSRSHGRSRQGRDRRSSTPDRPSATAVVSPPTAGGDDRSAARLRLDRDEPEGLVVRRDDDHAPRRGTSRRARAARPAARSGPRRATPSRPAELDAGPAVVPRPVPDGPPMTGTTSRERRSGRRASSSRRGSDDDVGRLERLDAAGEHHARTRPRRRPRRRRGRDLSTGREHGRGRRQG